jgi:hypothetical protein
MNAAEIARALGGERRSGAGWKCLCPAHRDTNPSLDLKDGSDGRILAVCRAGCSQEALVAELKSRNLWPDRNGASDELRRREYRLNYVDGSGEAIHVRVDLADGAKRFFWTPKGTKPSNLELYGISEALAGARDRVVLCEGEQAADSLRARGVPAVGTVTGASATPCDKALEPLLQFDRVVLWPDNDPPGARHMQRIAARLTALGAKDIRVVRWAEAPPNGDAADFHGDDEALRALLDAAKPVEVETGESNSSFSSFSSYPWPEIDPVAFYGLAGEFVNLVEPETEADPAALLLQFFAAFGSAAGAVPCRAPDGMTHYLRLFVLLVGATSKARKGSSWAWVRRLFELADPTWAQEQIQSGLSSGEGLIWAARDPITRREAVREKGKVVDYQTVEADPGATDKRLLMFEAEFAGTLRILERDGNSLSAVLRQAWDTGTLRIATKNMPAKATGVHISVVAHVTLDELLRYFGESEAASGFGNRFLFVCARRSKCLPRGGRVAPEALNALARKARAALEFARKVQEFSFSEDALAVWDKLYSPLSAERPGLLGALLARGEAQVCRLALVCAALDCSPTVKPAHLRAATALWEYCEASAEFVFQDRLGDPTADAILGALRERPAGMTRTEISGLFGRNLPVDRLERALASLLRANLVERRPKGSHTPETWFTKTTKTTNSTNAQERKLPESESEFTKTTNLTNST